MKKDLIKFLKKEIKNLDIDKFLDKPKIESQGDFTLPMFVLAKELKKSPQDVAKDYEYTLSKKLPSILEKVVAMGPFLNFYLNKEQLSKQVLESIENNSIFKFQSENLQKILIEYPSPNTNKALHVGHVRNLLLGNSISKIFTKVGHTIIKTNMDNDRGIAICKAMLAYQMFTADKTPKSEKVNPDKFVGNCYVLFGEKNESNPELKLEEKAQDMLLKYEQGDKETIQLWKKIMDWVFEGYSKTYERFKYSCDMEYFESKIYKEGKEIVEKALKDKIKGFAVDKENGAVFVDLEDVKLGKKYLLRGDGTTLYMTQDLYLAYEKERNFQADKYIFIVGNEQKYHFEVLFEILNRIGFGGLDKNYHFAFGMLYDKNGEAFSSRKGNAIDADELLDLIEEKALNNLKDKSPDLNKKESMRRSKIIGYSALTFGILKINPLDNNNFDIDSALSFEGDTGPYVQYTYARIQSILKKSKYKFNSKIHYSLYQEKELSLIKALKEYPQIIIEAAKKYRPSMIANYLIKVSQLFNDFYQNCPILQEEENLKQARLLLAKSTSKILKEGLELLDIETLEGM
ncbi:MAG: arginine--tRNA ligase [Candidatus Woesearchaeota archaeon]|jgi:arginyl-tRNA synthetase|nr:arginine--tRNA ligase [Candidatus Woesearchaeota archaeon]